VILTSGNKIIYPTQGPCLVGAVVQKMVGDRPIMFQELLVLSNGGKVFIPIDNVSTVGVRPLVKKSEIPKLLDRLKEPTRSADNWKERARDNLRLMSSGSAFALAQIVKSLTELSETKTLTFGDFKTLEKAKHLLICEIAEVMGETKIAVEEEIDKALKARTGQGRFDHNRDGGTQGREAEPARIQRNADPPTPKPSPDEPVSVPSPLTFWPWLRRHRYFQSKTKE
jgi:RNA polymerase-interacting CarD/CdnL/TRCF family regulator